MSTGPHTGGERQEAGTRLPWAQQQQLSNQEKVAQHRGLTHKTLKHIYKAENGNLYVEVAYRVLRTILEDSEIKYDLAEVFYSLLNKI